MGDSRPLPRFSHLDLDLDRDFGPEVERGAEAKPASGVAARDGRAALAPTVARPAAGTPTVIPPAPVCGAARQLSLTERHSIPVLLTSAGELSTLPLDHRAGFLLAHVDGIQTLEEILDVCAMPTAEALELIERLKRMGVIDFE